MVQRFLEALQTWGGIVTAIISISTERQLITQNPQYGLCLMDLDSSHWVQSLFRRMDLPKGILQTLTRSPTRKHTNISRLFQRCFSIDKRGATLNQR